MMGRIFNGPVDFETAANLTAQAPAFYEWDTFAEKNKVGRLVFTSHSTVRVRLVLPRERPLRAEVVADSIT